MKTVQERFWAKVDKTDECWLWTAATERGGYGMFTAHQATTGTVIAHRIAYQWLVGPIPEGHEVDHLCRVRNCVNPAHLEAVTHAENQRRRRGAKAHCPSGHLYDVANTYSDKHGYRSCRACNRESSRRRQGYYERRSA